MPPKNNNSWMIMSQKINKVTSKHKNHEIFFNCSVLGENSIISKQSEYIDD